MKAAADRCSINLNTQDYRDLIEGLDAIDPTKCIDSELSRYAELRARLDDGRSACERRKAAALIEQSLS